MNPLLPIRCLACSHDAAEVYISTITVLTVRCPQCSHVWCLDVRNLDDVVRKQLEAITHTG